jgi:hypothetical protein
MGRSVVQGVLPNVCKIHSLRFVPELEQVRGRNP